MLKEWLWFLFQKEEKREKGQLFATSVHQTNGVICCSATVAGNGSIANAPGLRQRTMT